jgi:uncharacterized OsmC-like protein
MSTTVSADAHTNGTDSGAALRSIADAIANAVAEDPAAGVVRFVTRGDGVDRIGTRMRIGRHAVRQDEPEAFGGTDAAPNPVEYALAALLSCQLVTYRYWAAKYDIPVTDISAEVDGGLDLRGFLGLDNAVRSGLDEVRVRVTIDGPAPAERYRELAAAVNAHCPTLDLFRNPTPVRTELIIGR